MTADSQKLKGKTHGVDKRLRTAESHPCKTKPATMGQPEKRESQNHFRALRVLHPPIQAMKKRVPDVFDECTKSTSGVFWSIVDDRFSVSAFVGLARSKKLHYAGFVASGVSPPTRYLLFQLRIKILSTFLSTKDDA